MTAILSNLPPAYAYHMQYTIKLFAEITIKSRPVRQRLVRLLRDNLRTLLKPLDPSIEVERHWDYLSIHSASGAAVQEQIVDVLARTPGISHYQRVHAFPLADFDTLLAHTLALYGPALTGKTFCVRCRRSGEHPFSSNDVERHIGAGLLAQCQTAGVKLKAPDITVHLEIRDDTFFVIEQNFPGLGGFPMASQEAVLSLLSGGFDSSVASYLSMKRGLLTHYCFFNLGGDAHERAVKEIAVFLWLKYGSSHRVKFISVPFADVVREIQETIHHSQMGVVLKRMMLRAAGTLAAQFDIQALVTGEAVAQVSSQTLPNLAVIDQAATMLVLRPLAMTDKPDIIRTSREIGTEVFAKNIPEYCGVISQKPTTRAKAERVEREESRFNFSVLEHAVATAIATNIDDIALGSEPDIPLPVWSAPPPNATVLDIRHPDETERTPLHLPDAQTHCLAMPFYLLHKHHTELNKSHHYLLYCERGVMSRLQAEFLRNQGFGHISLYKPASP